MKILAIDTSCDDTAVAILATEIRNPKHEIRNNKVRILSNIVSSQVKLHAKYGGVYPTLAKREHQHNLVVVLTKALTETRLLKILNPKSEIRNKSKMQNPKFKTVEKILEREEILRPKLLKFLEKYQKPKINAIAITIGPGLEPCLWVGVNFAKALALWWDLPIIPVNHLEAHLLANWLSPVSENPKSEIRNPKQIQNAKSKNSKKIEFPAVGLVVSGGNTQLFLIKGIGKYKLLGETRDDAAGECFDKTARILGLGYPGGPAIAANAAMEFKVKSLKLKVKLPRPMINSKDYDFSFSGLKTAVLYDYKKQRKAVCQSEEYKMAMAREIQQVVIDVLLKKTLRAAKEYQAKAIILGGGVASNQNLKQQFKVKSAKLKVDFLVPEKNFCTDNAAMVGISACFHFKNKQQWKYIKPRANITIQ
ncbi:tRNA (adenosine(37)-N6)-threonylcarbamoyltransferase complex transferase subunit TsaD [bacterium (Candidatus Gribaldobacteria) CG08_land_8_20_14_0_20_39_15]|uniref:tRNA N6-adenosine threonylcarbamoyltransferase n=1 Tax=bacterium (Candidatus Gribaldobacteria) CG08_land_8_20_14_0_20_39_15 TaxID=2014273 RepID=A0A2M6XVA8_9BACT|nr:MAG: tRNA (adenosine(37)-N6)-threonylcarbamoyltransferase complex transferase subunit TsaD [bacterium (Candidatus Gribaldobacteria) CG08_land_8_20_14_0_20_39_15]